jgi:hypothetical protein
MDNSVHSQTVNMKELALAHPERHTLEFMGHPQSATLIVTDNTVAQAIAHRECKQKRSKAIDMRYHWIREQVQLGVFRVEWQKGTDNLADFFTKIHPASHHNVMRRRYVWTDKLTPNWRTNPAQQARRAQYAVKQASGRGCVGGTAA